MSKSERKEIDTYHCKLNRLMKNGRMKFFFVYSHPIEKREVIEQVLRSVLKGKGMKMMPVWKHFRATQYTDLRPLNLELDSRGSQV
ncbi:hypothetical protein NPIL_579561 [Nephila pilipes]|uniref:Uncharacterized protein n=1 Tax=Nephila pilipes TaxID=299642 RepID=A0A8X6P600_NEPPI|nr:hypothetical protein NPIL_221221 [Nephila pilipes]GFT53478.1 hypothetical protein NPIL_579561 [Nephila pilipes]